MSHREFILAGTGGQGLIFAAILLAEAAMADGKNVLQTQSYGIASRGGFSSAEVIIDDGEIIFQQVEKPDAIVALTEEAVAKYESWPARGVPLLYDDLLASRRHGKNFLGYPFTRLADEAKNPDSANLVALGALVGLTAAVGAKNLEALVGRRFKGPARQLNLCLLAIGLALPKVPAS